jgi:two-component system, NtrC family, sensor kinase
MARAHDVRLAQQLLCHASGASNMRDSAIGALRVPGNFPGTGRNFSVPPGRLDPRAQCFAVKWLHFAFGAVLALARATMGPRSSQFGPPGSTTPNSWSLVALMVTAIAAVTGLAWWDDQREADAALRDLETQQTVVASSLAGSLRAHLGAVEHDAVRIAERGAADLNQIYRPAVVRPAAAAVAATTDPSRFILSVPVSDGRRVDLGVTAGELLGADLGIERAGELTVFLSVPGEGSFYATDGRSVASPPLRTALDDDVRALRLERPQAAEIGLPARTAMAGFAHVDAGALGQWGVAAVASAARERDREKRALGRLMLSVLVTTGLVLAFGGAALRKQRKELELSRELAIAEVQRSGDEALAQAQRVATMGTFAMGIAHEVSTPLGVIMGRAEQLLGRVKDDERAVHNAQAILKQTDRIQQIVRRFLDMARGGPPSLERADPSEVARAAAASVQHRFSKAQVGLATDIPSTMPDIQCDRALLEQAIVNLLLNACEACQPGEHVEIAARADAESVAFVVTDDGAGIPSEHAARATKPFFTTKAEAGGAGLGLAIATEIAKSHRGDLTIGPHAGRGTRARIEIPVAGQRGGHA